jgi:hypothetical protein
MAQCRLWDNVGGGGDDRGEGSVVFAFSPFVINAGDAVTVPLDAAEEVKNEC